MLQTDDVPRKKRKAISRQPVNNRSRVTTGKSLFVTGDGRGAFGRRFKDLVFLHCEDLGGVDSLSEFQLSLVRRVSTLEVELERMESELAEGKPVDVDSYARISSHLRRIVETLGLERVVRIREPTLKEIVAKHRECAASAPKSSAPIPTADAKERAKASAPIPTADAKERAEASPAPVAANGVSRAETLFPLGEEERST